MKGKNKINIIIDNNVTVKEQPIFHVYVKVTMIITIVEVWAICIKSMESVLQCTCSFNVD